MASARVVAVEWPSWCAWGDLACAVSFDVLLVSACALVLWLCLNTTKDDADGTAGASGGGEYGTGDREEDGERGPGRGGGGGPEMSPSGQHWPARGRTTRRRGEGGPGRDSPARTTRAAGGSRDGAGAGAGAGGKTAAGSCLVAVLCV
ncbi:hypothetical protein Pelo_11506, partial [Pelomyxa schiedti]